MSDEGREVATTTRTDALSLFGMGVGGVRMRPEKLGIRIPWLKPVSGSLKAAAIEAGWRPGYWKLGKNRLFPSSEIEVLLLMAREVRHYDRPEEGSAFDQIVCASFDCITPERAVFDRQAEMCADCPVGEWTDHPTKLGAGGKPRRIPPACQEGLAFLGILPDDPTEWTIAPTRWSTMLTFWLLVEKRLDLPAAKKYVRALPEEYGVRQLYGTTTVLGTTRNQNEKGDIEWYEATFAKGRNLDPLALVPFVKAAWEWTPPFFLYRGPQEGPASEPPDNQAPPPEDEDIPF